MEMFGLVLRSPVCLYMDLYLLVSVSEGNWTLSYTPSITYNSFYKLMLKGYLALSILETLFILFFILFNIVISF